MKNIRNFVVISHVDHGKSTLADRLLEITGTVPKRLMRAQYLDQLELERERGITIKMAPVRMSYIFDLESYILNLIDTPGHSDFSYEVSRALAAVEGAVLLVDAIQGIQAQTLANFRSAQNASLKIIGAVNKVDLFKDRNDERLKLVINDISNLLGVPKEEIFLISGKTGEGAEELLEAIIKKIPSPAENDLGKEQALIFDSFFDNHKGVMASVRIFSGVIKNSDEIYLIATETNAKIKELGIFAPEFKPVLELKNGEIGYIATGIKEPAKIKIGDTILRKEEIKLKKDLALSGFKEPMSVVFVSFYPEESDDYDLLKKGLQKLKLNDSALSIEPDQNEVLGRGYKVGFLGRLHFEITSERLKREFNIKTVNTFPSVLYKVKQKNKWLTLVKPEDLPQDYDEIWEPMVKIEILLPAIYLNNIFGILNRFRLMNTVTEKSGLDRVKIKADMPLAELVSDFDDQLKSATEGYSSFSYEFFDYLKSDLIKVDILLAGEMVPGLSRFLPKNSYERESRKTVERLKELLPKQQFSQAIQAVVEGRVIAREDILALRKDVTGYLYGGDRSRKMKLWKKQKRGKERLKGRGKVRIDPDTFKELLKH